MCHLYIKFFKNNTMYIFVYKYIFILFLSGTQGYVTNSWERLFLLLSCSVMSDSLQPHGLHHARLPGPSPSPGICSNSCPLSRWCHPTISSSVIPFSCPQSFSSSGSFPMREKTLCIRWPKYWSFSFSTSLSNEYSGLISFRIDGFDILVVQGTLPGIFSSTTVQKHQFLGIRPSLWSSSHICTWLLEKQ